jgi:hypothetical protein
MGLVLDINRFSLIRLIKKKILPVVPPTDKALNILEINGTG